MTFENFFIEVEKRESGIILPSDTEGGARFLDNESLFQLPLISLIVLIMASGQRKPIVSELGQLVGETIESVFTGFKGSARHLGWSALLRIRTVKSVSFLELSGFIEIRNKDSRLAVTKKGQKLLKSVLSKNSELASNLLEVKDAFAILHKDAQYEAKLI
ncbi:hypothetical protein [Teredinibacter franksiae]|uniref:hypothetical protein n=1 Tax=Teredinibacter franksiae TaxID=2761453 RepID=UPI00162AB004|nr:hypothetical protein [Teredinibacter franksiae]